VVFMAIIAAGLAVGSALGLYRAGEGLKARQEAVGEGIAKSITWITLAVGIALVLIVLVFFMTRSKATAQLGKGVAVTGGGAPQTGGGPK